MGDEVEHGNLSQILTLDWVGMKPKDLRCPFCGSQEHQRLANFSFGYETVLFKCLFGVVFRMHTAESEKKRILEEKKQSGELEKLLRNPFIG